MHCVYKFSFTNRIKSSTMPYYYIGSKSNCVLVDGKLMQNGKVYSGSSHYQDWSSIVEDDYEVEILHTFDDYKACVEAEYAIQKNLDVVANPEYFNLGMAAKNNFADPNYGTYKHASTGKRVRLPTDHPAVLSGEYVGATKGTKHSDEHRANISASTSGELNPFFGRHHAVEAKAKIAKANSERIRGPEERAKTSARFKGVPKSDEHKSKIGRKGMTSVVNIHTNECVRGYPVDLPTGEEWVALGTITAMRAVEMTCPHCGSKSKSVGNMKRWHNDNCKMRK